jgi:hypothetical protein
VIPVPDAGISREWVDFARNVHLNGKPLGGVYASLISSPIAPGAGRPGSSRELGTPIV